mmetsp:Transcript_5663/g.14393  ORF Transcript_5663/g.14393 Transcript_5663/m.14393 type:complete len:147 (+) Transcript_5663:177-617(+)
MTTPFRQIPQPRSSSQPSQMSRSAPQARRELPPWTLHPQTRRRCLRANSLLPDYFEHMANEPSIGLYHVQEHIRRSVPFLASTQRALDAQKKKAEDVCYDLDFALLTVKGFHEMDGFQKIKRQISASIMAIEAMEQQRQQQEAQQP